jgi:hypothetical protein
MSGRYPHAGGPGDAEPYEVRTKPGHAGRTVTVEAAVARQPQLDRQHQDRSGKPMQTGDMEQSQGGDTVLGT